MAGGKITRIIKGTNSIECEKWEVYTDNFSAYANKGSYFTADGGTNFGTPKDPPPPNKYFEKLAVKHRSPAQLLLAPFQSQLTESITLTVPKTESSVRHS